MPAVANLADGTSPQRRGVSRRRVELNGVAKVAVKVWA